ncbi:MAG: tautomerase family protein [Thermococcus sp.]|nr:tautomerase family protein [Thermococcus sp.]
MKGKTSLVVGVPTIIVEGPKADVETKRELVKRITEVVREVYKVHHVSVVIHENEPENVGVDGELLQDIIAKRKG